MKFLPRRENRAERKVKAFKATKQGIAGHQAAMKAFGNASFKAIMSNAANNANGSHDEYIGGIFDAVSDYPTRRKDLAQRPAEDK